jgi:hypothetical protein
VTDSRRANWFSRAALVGFLLCSTAANASSTSTLIKGPSSLKIKVIDHRGRPVQGAVIVVNVFVGHTQNHTNEYRELSRFNTNDRGEAIIQRLPSGDYEINLDETVIRFFEHSVYFKVINHSKGQGEFVFHWPPQDRVIVTSTLSGMLHRWETTSGKNGIETSLNRANGLGKTLPITSTELALFRFFSGEKVGEAKTDEEGRFDMKDAEAGLYYMRFPVGSSEETIVLELDRDFIGAAPTIDILIEDIIVNGDAPQYRSLNGGVIHKSGDQQ